MQTIPLSSIVVPPRRFRRDFDPVALQELVESIRAQGLLQPPVIRREGGQVLLVAGERRLRALADAFDLGYSIRHGTSYISPDAIPVLDVGELDDLARREAEYAENAVRRDFTWQENVAALEELSKLRTEQAAAAGLPAPTVSDLAIEVRGSAEGSYLQKTRQELIVAQHLDDPEIAAAKTATEAYKILVKKERAAENTALAVAVGKSLTASAHTILNEDSMQWLAAAEPEQFDVILTDPPYGMGADKFGDSGGKTAGAHEYEDSPEILHNLLNDGLMKSLYKVARPQAHIDWYYRLLDEARDAGWRVHRTPFIWYKPSGSRMPWPQHGPQRRYEVILYAVKGDKPIERVAGDVLVHNPDDNLGHAAQKPVSLFIDLLSRSARPGMRVLDPFAGTGPAVAAAHLCKCFCTAIEKDQASYGIIVSRLAEIAEEPQL
jgi:ParB/RepB/Spo0J family partition protein